MPRCEDVLNSRQTTTGQNIQPHRRWKIGIVCLLSLCLSSHWATADDTLVSPADSSSVSANPQLSFLNEGAVPTTIGQLRAMEEHVKSLNQRIKEATVNIRMGQGQGTGVLVSSDGLILTAAHVIGEPRNRRALITFSDGRRGLATTLGVETGKDSGMLKVYRMLPTEEDKSDSETAPDETSAEGNSDDKTDSKDSGDDQTDGDQTQSADEDKSDEDKSGEDKSTRDDGESDATETKPEQDAVDVVEAAFAATDLPFFNYLDIGVSTGLKDGQWVMAVGHPGGLDEDRGMVVRVGRILNQSATVIRTDCTLVGGDSGGPLVDMDGYLIGIHSRIGSRLQDNLHVPVDVYSNTWDWLAKGYKIGDPGRLGIGLGDGTNTITSLTQGGPCEKVGIEEGDVIIELAGQSIADRDDVAAAMKGRHAYETINIKVKRDDEDLEFDVLLVSKAYADALARRNRRR